MIPSYHFDPCSAIEPEVEDLGGVLEDWIIAAEKDDALIALYIIAEPSQDSCVRQFRNGIEMLRIDQLQNGVFVRLSH